MTNIPGHDDAFKFVNDDQDVAILLSETEEERAQIVFVDLQEDGWQWFIEGDSVDYPSEWQMPLDGPHTLRTLYECGEDAIDFVKLYCSQTGDLSWLPAIPRINTFVSMNSTIGIRKQLGPGTRSHGYNMEV